MLLCLPVHALRAARLARAHAYYTAASPQPQCAPPHAGALPAAHALNKVPQAFAAALLRRPFVTILNSMTDPSLPMTVHEYDEWGDPADKAVVAMWAHLSPHKQIREGECGASVVCMGCCLSGQLPAALFW